MLNRKFVRADDAMKDSKEIATASLQCESN